MRTAVIVLLATLAATACPAAAWAQPAAIVLEYGEKSGGEAVVDRGPDRAEGGLSPTHTVHNSRFLNRSDEIDAALCRSFGVSGIIVLRPGQSFPREVTAVIHHPLMMRPDGASSDHVSLPVPVVGGHFGAEFSFDQPWEMAVGEWTFAFHDGGRMLAMQSFTVRPPQPDAAASVCAPIS